MFAEFVVHCLCFFTEVETLISVAVVNMTILFCYGKRNIT